MHPLSFPCTGTIARHSFSAAGFTLIELSIVLVIIGLIVGSVLVGQDLIHAAEVRATITQIEKYNTAVNAFRGKYGALRGDLNAATATQFGFAARGTNRGEGDGNGIIEAYVSGTPTGVGVWGEATMFWEDLSYANGLKINLIEGFFSTATSNTVPGGQVTGPAINLYLPQAKLGRGNYIYAYSGGGFGGDGWDSTGVNYFGMGVVTDIDPGSSYSTSQGLTVQQAYSIDRKLDDGYPQTGNVTATYIAGGLVETQVEGTPATAGSATTCYDNANVGSATQQYSVEQNNGAGVNCSLSFRFQ